MRFICMLKQIYPQYQRLKVNIYTNDFQFTYFIIGRRRIPIWIWWMSSIVVVDDVSPIVTACNGQVVRYWGSGIVCVLETRYTILFIGCIRNENRESKKSAGVIVSFIYQNKHIVSKHILKGDNRKTTGLIHPKLVCSLLNSCLLLPKSNRLFLTLQ